MAKIDRILPPRMDHVSQTLCTRIDLADNCLRKLGQGGPTGIAGASLKLLATLFGPRLQKICFRKCSGIEQQYRRHERFNVDDGLNSIGVRKCECVNRYDTETIVWFANFIP